MIDSVCVVGAGTMGSGIAFCAAQNGYPVLLYDVSGAMVDRAMDSLHKNTEYLLGKKSIDAAGANALLERVKFSTDIADCRAALVIEAIVEDLRVKRGLFATLANINGENTVLATNTSSLSISAIQEAIACPDRVVGIHFFNPPHIMKLVEVIRGAQTSDDTMGRALAFCKTLHKETVICKDSPGFIVNRVARPFYLEAMRIAQNDDADIGTIDRALIGAGFKMGPFALMDLIGLDVNLAVSRSVHEAMGKPARLQPAPMQETLVSHGHLGKKTKKGFYDYE